MHDPRLIREAVEAREQADPATPAEEVAAVADGGLGYDDLAPSRWESISMRYGTCAITDILDQNRAEADLPFQRQLSTTRRSWFPLGLAAAATVALTGGLVVIGLMQGGSPTAGPGPGAVADGGDPNAGIEANEGPGLPEDRRALGDDHSAGQIETVDASLFGDDIRAGLVVVRDSGRYHLAVQGTALAEIEGIVRRVDKPGGTVELATEGTASAWVSAQEGPVRIGDLLVIGDRPGILRLAGADDRAIATSLGVVQTGSRPIEVRILQADGDGP